MPRWTSGPPPYTSSDEQDLPASLPRGAAALGVSGAGVGLYTWQVEPHWVELVRRKLPVPGLPPALDGATLVQISDVHVGPRVDSEYLIDTLRQVARFEPDLVAVTGDWVSYQSARHLLQVRFNVRPEVTVFTLVAG